MWKIRVYEERLAYNTEPSNQKEDVLVHTMESADKKVIAAFLRGVADAYDPKTSSLR